MDEEPEECVQVVFTNLIKKCKKNDKKESGNLDEYEASGVIVNGKVYHFNLKSLMEKEPANNLLNIHACEIKKRVNPGNHTIEYPLNDYRCFNTYGVRDAIQPENAVFGRYPHNQDLRIF